MEHKEEKAERTIVVEWPGWWAAFTIAAIRSAADTLQGRGVDVPITAVSKRTGEKHLGTLKRLSRWEIMHLKASEGDEILFRASGPGAEEAIEMFLAVVEVEMQKIREHLKDQSQQPED